VLGSINSDKKSPQVKQLLQALYTFLEYKEKHQVINFHQRLASGMSNLVDLLLGVRLTKVERKRFVDTDRALEGLKEDQFAKNHVDQALFVWLREACDLGLAYKHEETKVETPSHIKIIDDISHAVSHGALNDLSHSVSNGAPNGVSNGVSYGVPIEVVSADNKWKSLCPYSEQELTGPKREEIYNQAIGSLKTISFDNISELKSFNRPP
jgi:hypothetical protein